MRTLLLAIALLTAASALADHPAITFAVYRTDDIRQLVTANGPAALDGADLADKALARGYSSADSTVSITTPELTAHIQIVRFINATAGPGTYAYALSLEDRQQKKQRFFLAGTITPGAAPTLPQDWEKAEFTPVFALVNLKR